VALERRRDVREQDKFGVAVRGRQLRSERFEHAQLGGESAAVVHVQFIFAGPMKRFAGQLLQTLKINAVAVVELDVFLGEILADDADEFYGREKTRRHRRMAAGTAEQPGIFRVRSFDGVQGGGTDDNTLM